MRSASAVVSLTGPRSAFRMHGVSISIESDEPNLLGRLHGRLAPFSAPDGPEAQADLRFEFRLAQPVGGLEAMPGPQRTVYRIAELDFRYDETYDLLWVSSRNRPIGVCNPNLGIARFEIETDAAADLELYSDTVFTICLLELMKRHSRFSLHAAGISIGGAGILLAGPSGAGKSTAAIVLLQSLGRRAGFLGDDMVFLSYAAGELHMLGWPEPIDVGAWTQQKLPALQSRMEVAATAWRKGRIAPSKIAGAIPALAADPQVIVFPRLTSRTSSAMTAMSQDEALLELAPNVLLTEATSSQAHLAALGALGRQCRCYRLEAGSDIERLPHLLLGLL
jgi:hypothetical protein